MESQTFNLPAEMNNVLSATISDTVNGEILFCHDQQFLYAAKIAKVGGSVIFQRFNLPNLAKLIPIIKNYFIALFSTSKLVVFEVTFNEDGKVNLKYIFNKMEKPCSSYFLREVVENMAELHLFYPQSQLFVYQFTINGKIGYMNYTIGPQNKIKCERAQLYGSKTIVCPQRKTFYFLNNFSSKNINILNLNKLETQVCEQLKTTPLTYICLPKIEEHYLILGNMTVVNIQQTNQRHKIHIDQEYQKDMGRLLERKAKPTFKISTYFDLILIQDAELKLGMILQIKQKGSSLIAVEYGNFNWFWTSSRKLVGFSPTRNCFRMIENLKMNHGTVQEGPVSEVKGEGKEQKVQVKNQNNKWKEYAEKLMMESNQFIKSLQNQGSSKSLQKTEEKLPEGTESNEEPKKFVPKKVIQKKGVNLSKTVSKSKQNEPFSLEETRNQGSVEDSAAKEDEPVQAKPEIATTPENVKEEEKAEEDKTSDFMLKQQQQLIDFLDSKSPIKEDNNETNPVKTEDVAIDNGQEKKQNSQKERGSEDNIAKNLTLMFQRKNLVGVDSHPTTINRNNIFSSPPLMIANHLQTKLKHTQSQSKQFYNPLLSQSPLSSRKEEASEEPYNIELIQGQEDMKDKRNEEVLNQIKQLFERTTVRLVKTLDEVVEGNKLEPYLKQIVIREVQAKVIDTLRRQISGPFGLKLQNYFKEVLKQVSVVQQESNNFYKAATMHRSGLIEVQLNNQQKILKEVKQVENMIRFSIAKLRTEGIDFHSNLIRDWADQMKEAKKIINNLESFKSRLQEEALERNKRYDQTKKELENIKNLLLDKVKRDEEKKQKEAEIRESKMQEMEKKKKVKKEGREGKERREKEKKLKTKKEEQL